jgi:hypothetical protein
VSSNGAIVVCLLLGAVSRGSRSAGQSEEARLEILRPRRQDRHQHQGGRDSAAARTPCVIDRTCGSGGVPRRSPVGGGGGL